MSGDRYQGRPEALIAAGVITFDQIPATTAQTFIDGKEVDGRRFRGAHDERWMHVSRYSKTLIVTKGISDAERARRIEARERETEELARSTPRRDPGFKGIQEMDYQASAAFLVGEEVIASGEPATITVGFGMHRVAEDEGPFIVGAHRFEYRPGYTCRLHNGGKDFFYAPHQVRSKTDEMRHLLVVGIKTPPQAAPWPFPTVYGSVPA